MLFALDLSGERVRATRDGVGACPGCKAELIPKCGMINIHHWAHKAGDCDPWYEPEGQWHLEWKTRAPSDWCEVFMGPHRADIRTSTGLVIELQHSAIAPEDVLARENFYGDMIWVIDARQYAGPFYFEERDDGSVEFMWRTRFPKRWRFAQRQLYFDFGPRILEFGGKGDTWPNLNWCKGRLRSRDEFLRSLGLRGIDPAEREQFGVWVRGRLRGQTARPGGKPDIAAYRMGTSLRTREDAVKWLSSEDRELIFADGSIERAPNSPDGDGRGLPPR